MKYLKKYENPDSIISINPITNKLINVHWSNHDSVVFCYYNDEMLIGFNKTHRELLEENDLNYDIESNGLVIRTIMDYPGRIWVKNKVISFWIYPTPEKLPKILDDIEEEYNKHIDSVNIDSDHKLPKLDFNDPDWLIEVFDNNLRDPNDYDWRGTQKLVPLSNYTGSRQRSKKELLIPHLLNWKEKQELKKKGWGKGFGSDMTAWDSKNPLAWRQAKYQESMNLITKFKLFENPN